MAKKHSHEEIERALLELARCNGNTSRAQAELKKQGLPIHRTTLGRWVNEQHRARYLEIEAEVLPEIRRRLAAKIEDLLKAEVDAERETLERYRASLDELPARDLSPALRNLAVSKGIAADKAAQLRGLERQEKPVTYEGFTQLLDRIVELGGGAIKRVANIDDMQGDQGITHQALPAGDDDPP